MSDYDVTTAGASFEFETDTVYQPGCVLVDENHYVTFWRGTGSDSTGQVMEINTSTWAITTANSTLVFNTGNGGSNACMKVDTNHFINFYSGDVNEGFVGVFTINTSTWALTTSNSALEFDTDAANHITCCQIDTNHFVAIWHGAVVTKGFAQSFVVDTSTWAVTTAGSRFEWLGTTVAWQTCQPVGDNHIVHFWQGADADGFTEVLAVNTSTWAITTASSVLEFDTQNYYYGKSCTIDTNHFALCYAGNSALGNTQMFAVNTSTWAVTTAGAKMAFTTQEIGYPVCVTIDDNHFVVFYGNGTTSEGKTETFGVNTSTWAITNIDTLVFDTAYRCYNAALQVDTNYYVSLGAGLDGDGYAQVFNVELTALQTLDFLVNMKLAPTFATMVKKTFLENTKLTSIFTKTLTMLKTFTENIKLTPLKLFITSKTFLSNIVSTSVFTTLTSKVFLSNTKLTSNFAKITTFFKTFALNIKLKTFYRMIYGGIIVGVWKKVAKTSSSIWTKIIKN